MRFILAALLWAGCGSSALQGHTTAARVSRSSLDIAADTIESACTVRRAAEMEAERAGAGRDFARRCIKAEDVQHLAVAAWSAYLDSVLLAVEQERDIASLMPLFWSFADLYREMGQLLQPYGVTFPELPEPLP